MYSISIILPVYNGIDYLEQSVCSVFRQSFENFELLIIDDCSTDGSWEYLQSLQDGRIKVFRNTKNMGLFYNLNFLIKNSQSSLIKLWSQDDIMYPNCIKEVIAFHQLYPQIGFSYTGSDYIDANGNNLLLNKTDETPTIISRDLHYRIACITGSIAGNISNVTITKIALDKVGLFNEQMKISGDFEMWVRISEEYYIGFLKKPLIQLRNHKAQLSNKEDLFIYHLKEDVQVFNYMFSYLTVEQKKQGMVILRNQKLLFYYTLMLKAAFKGHTRLAADFLKYLSKFDNIFILTWFFIKRRVFKTKPEF